MGISQKVSYGQRRQMIAEAAYFRAERRGSGGTDPVRDWCEAEAEVDARLGEIERDEHLLDRLVEGLDAASHKLAALKKKMSGRTAEVRAEWHEDVAKLAELRDALQTKIEEIRKQGQHAGERVRQQAEKIRDEIADILQRVSAKVRH